MHTKAVTGSETTTKSVAIFSPMIPKWMRWPHDFVARVAGIFQTLNVLLSVLFRITYPVGFEVTSGARTHVETFLDHGLNSCHRVRVNNWCGLYFSWLHERLHNIHIGQRSFANASVCLRLCFHNISFLPMVRIISWHPLPNFPLKFPIFGGLNPPPSPFSWTTNKKNLR